jgi:hypothetical protein
LRLRLPSEEAYFDLANGVTGSSTTGISASMTDVENGWYRCEVAISDMSSNPNIFVHIAEGDGDIIIGGTPSGNDGLYIYAAQLESGLVATEVLTSGATTGKAGVLVDLPRINYDANGENGSLLLEPSRQNKIQFSEYYGDSSWNNSNEVTRSISSIVSPEGFLNAYDIIPTTANTNHTLRAPNLSGFTSGAVVNVSFFAKEKGYKFISVVGGFGSSNTPAVVFNLEAGTIESGTGTIEDYGNGWYRCISPITLNATALYCVGTILNDSQSGSFSGDATKGISVFGYQIEEATYPSSYIPNHGESGGVTRAADSCSVTGVSDVIGQTEGTMFVEAQITKNGRLFLIGATGNFIELVTTSGGVINAFVYNGSSQANINGSTIFDTGDTIKVAFAYKANDFALYVNGTANGTDTNGAVPSSMAQIIVNDYLSAGYNSANGYKQLALFNERLSNAELATLTTL